jgi:hypothetical protein
MGKAGKSRKKHSFGCEKGGLFQNRQMSAYFGSYALICSTLHFILLLD